jgi:O-acetyl-ADP-ribose deacetylase
MKAPRDRVQVVRADITTLNVDMIVNAANAALTGGGGVDGAIHRAAGPELLRECRTLGGAKTGEVKVTAGYKLPARFVAHAVGPVWNGGKSGEEAALASCYRRGLALAVERGCRSIAFPAISTGAYRFPVALAAQIAAQTVIAFLETETTGLEVTFCCFQDQDVRAYLRGLNDIALPSKS